MKRPAIAVVMLIVGVLTGCGSKVVLSGTGSDQGENLPKELGSVQGHVHRLPVSTVVVIIILLTALVLGITILYLNHERKKRD